MKKVQEELVKNIKGQKLIEKEAVETGKVRKKEKEAEEHSVLTLTLVKRSQCQLPVAPLQPEHSTAWRWCPRSPTVHYGGGRTEGSKSNVVLGVTGCDLLGSDNELNFSTGEVLHVHAVPPCCWFRLFLLSCHGLCGKLWCLCGDQPVAQCLDR